MLVLGIETSCDETGVALYDTELGLVADALHSQVDLHAVYGGVVPEIASRDHVRMLLPLIQRVMSDAGADRPDAIRPRPRDSRLVSRRYRLGRWPEYAGYRRLSAASWQPVAFLVREETPPVPPLDKMAWGRRRLVYEPPGRVNRGHSHIPPERRGCLMGEVTRILSAIEQGDGKAADELLPLFYEELRKLAAQKMSSP